MVTKTYIFFNIDLPLNTAIGNSSLSNSKTRFTHRTHIKKTMSTAFVERTHLDYCLFHWDDKGYFSFVIDPKFERTCTETCIEPQTEFVLPPTGRHELKYVINGQHASVFFILYLRLSFHIYIPYFLSELIL